MPTITSAFNSLDEQSWIATAYLLMSTVFQPFFGHACDFFGCKVQRNGRDRIRNVWENMRDCLGLHSRNSVLGGLNSMQSDGASDHMRPGDMMLAEMARALNIGLGLPNDNSVPTGTSSDRTGPSGEAGSGGNTSSQTVTTDSADRPAPAEDSFEHFLLNLWNDLRIALSEDGAAERPQRDSVHSSHSSSSTTPAQQDLAPVAGPSSMHSGTSVNQSEYPVPESEDPDEDNPPQLEDGSDSEDEYDVDDEEDMDDEHDVHDEHDHGTDTPHSPRSPTPIPGGRRAPGVNLWRLYRFQPIPALQTQGHAATTSVAGSATSDSHPPSSTTTTPLDTPAEGAEPSEPQAPSPAATHPNANVVVPVIVVDHMQPSDDVRSTESSLGSAENWQNQSSTAPMDIPSRGRPWHSRAADALRPLLPGRRSGSHNRQSTDANGARTFLIYVIGGYYPPNHHMVTGSDSLDSYEALWELAELLRCRRI
ncbi:hypothetical protein WOLCODRAFT_154069 [Wolfiporia cocos MD-104 SS10]|uniref:Uncharacterized protein n=1 Tax=Wolfiporia cocos (strain MD-104) TaxID=742152 RepID=A0A2H3K4P2_WOLCO|nr:hypothetical protein WOLCODRAFT_154069 [Wolfiporia cocos MD-104 SS10]